MLSLSKVVPSLAHVAFKNSVRTVYPTTYFGIHNFQLYTERFRKENSQNANLIKNAVKDAVTKPDAKIFTEDLKSYLYYANTDEEIDILIQGIKKHNNQSQLSLLSFSFEEPLMRLLYSMNKTDKALEAYYKDDIFNKSFSIAMLLNKLVSESRYDDAIKLWGHFFAKFKSAQKTGAGSETANKNNNSIFISSKIYTEALLKKGNVEALEKGKALMKEFGEMGQQFGGTSIGHLILLALENNQKEFAYELVEHLKANERGDEIKSNLKILTLASLGRTDEALHIAEEMSKRSSKRLFFDTTLKSLGKAVEADEAKKKQVESILNEAKRGERFFEPADLFEYLCKGRNYRARKIQSEKDQQQPRYKNNMGPLGQRERFNQRQEQWKQKQPEQGKKA